MPDTITPLLSPLPPEEWDPTLARVKSDMGGNPINVHRLMAHNPQLLNAWWNFRNYSVNGGTLGKRLGELVILRVGIQLGAWYEWGSHVDRSLRCGLTLEEINRVLDRTIAPDWAPQEAALLQAVDELIECRCLSQETMARLSAELSVPQILDIIAIHGMYVILGCMINSLGLELDTAIAARIADHTTPDSFRTAAVRFHGEQNPAGECA